jgi:hypothetical protein
MARFRKLYQASIVIFGHSACPISFTHHRSGPVANVEALLPGGVTPLDPLYVVEFFPRAPPIGYVNQEHCIIYHNIEGIAE